MNSSTKTEKSSWPQAIIGLLWLGLLAYCILNVWKTPRPEDHGTPYFQKEIAASPGTPNSAWEERFEVRQPRQQFYVHITPRSGSPRLFIELAAASGTSFFTGPITNQTRFYCGSGVPAGTYVFKVRDPSAEGAYAVQITGVDFPTESAGNRLFKVMVCTALLVLVPVYFLQKRLLRYVDPDLEFE